MTPEQKLDRLERLAKLFAREGLRARRKDRHQDEKIDILIDAQIKNEENFARNEGLFARLAESQIHTDRRLDALIDIIREGRNGESLPQT
jgi:hypothetical protein